MMQQYIDTKKQYPDCILFYRLGDFYEMFFEDALLASKVLEITLTGKECGLKEKAPMCGVPYHAVDAYLYKLVQKGYKVAIAEQMEDPKQSKGLVRREVIRIVTPGTIMDTKVLSEDKNQYLLCVLAFSEGFALAVADVTTGTFLFSEIEDEKVILDEIDKFAPAEILCNATLKEKQIISHFIKERLGLDLFVLDLEYFKNQENLTHLREHFSADSLEKCELFRHEKGQQAVLAIWKYLHETQKNSLVHFTEIHLYFPKQFMFLDSFTRRNLELQETLREKKKKGSLLGLMDCTKTSMGARRLRICINEPLISSKDIQARQDAVEMLLDQYIGREEMRKILSKVHDLERFLGKVSYQTVNPRDLISFKQSLLVLPEFISLLQAFQVPLLDELRSKLDLLEDLQLLIQEAILDEPSLSIKEGNIVKEGFHQKIDELKQAKIQGKKWLADLEEKERSQTGIKNLKVKFSKTLGYCFEITNTYKGEVPQHFIQRQTLTNAKRYTTVELKSLEEKILGAQEQLYDLEYEVFCQIRGIIVEAVLRIQTTSSVLAELDVLLSFAHLAAKYNYCKPQITQDGIISIQEGRHPVIESLMESHLFVANDTFLDENEHLISVITGPNMSGKSTFMRQTALIVLMAQMGSFVPASSAKIGICDRIFTRVGASDDLAAGQSTFMVEMSELAEILNHATKNSLLILDEIGRGTSTFDGMSIAWAVLDYISEDLRAKTLFATHYHELTDLEGTLKGVCNYCIEVKESGEEIIFLRKIIRGKADKSYGIHVAALAGLPPSILSRAKEVARNFGQNQSFTIRNPLQDVETDIHIGSFDHNQNVKEDGRAKKIVEQIRKLDIERITPLEALNQLSALYHESIDETL